jgi:anti-anti-sigma regulatory factor
MKSRPNQAARIKEKEGTMAIVEHGPFEIREDRERKLAIVTFAERCYQYRSKADEDTLAGLVERFDLVACDLTHTDAIASEWLRWMARMSIQANSAGKKLFLVGVKEQVLKTADVLGLKEELRMVKTLDEGLAA